MNMSYVIGILRLRLHPLLRTKSFTEVTLWRHCHELTPQDLKILYEGGRTEAMRLRIIPHDLKIFYRSILMEALIVIDLLIKP